MAIYFALVPKLNYEESWTEKIKDVFYNSMFDFYIDYKDGIILNLDIFTKLFNEGQISHEVYWIQKVNVR
jgi:hypothetical protein